MMWEKTVIIEQLLNLNYQSKNWWRELKTNCFVVYLGRQKEMKETIMIKSSASFIIQRKIVLVNSFYLIYVYILS